MSYEERGFEGPHSKVDDECVVLELSRNVGCDLNFVANALFLDCIWIGDEQHLASAVAQGVFEFALPIVAAFKSQNICPDFITQCRELGAQPDREGIVLWRGMTDEDHLARFGVRVFGFG